MEVKSDSASIIEQLPQESIYEVVFKNLYILPTAFTTCEVVLVSEVVSELNLIED